MTSQEGTALSLDRTLGDLLKFAPTNGPLNQAAKDKLVTACGTIKISDLMAHDGGSLADLLYTADSTLTNDCDLLAVAELLITMFARANAKVDSSPASAPAAPATTVNVVLPKSLGDKDLKELLTALVEQPEKADEIIGYLTELPQVRRALAKTDRLVIVRDGQLDVEETVKYITRLAREDTKATEMVDGVRPTTFAKAAGTESRSYIHPFTGEAVEGPDELGFDFMKLPEELHCALLWAQVAKHPAWPTVIDRFAMSTELFADLSEGSRWTLILRAFRAAKADDDEIACAIPRLYPKDFLKKFLGDSGSRLPFGGSTEPERDEAWYEAAVRAVRPGREISVGSGSQSARQCIVPFVRVGSGLATLDRVLVFESVVVGSGTIRGTALTAPRAGIRQGVGVMSRDINRASSWKDFYDQGVEWGIIRP